MKKILFFCMVFCSFAASAQIYQSQNGYGFQYKRLKIDSTLHIPTFCGEPTLTNSVIGNQSAIAFDSCNNLLYVYNPKDSTWGTVQGGSSGLDSIYFASSSNTDTVKGVNSDGAEFIIGIIDTKDGLISGGVVTQGSSPLVFDVTPAIYKVNATRYNSAAGSVTLPAGGDLDVIYGIGVDTLQQIIVIAGEPSENPKDPQIDPSLGIILTKVRVNAHATTPAGISSILVYDENTETWTHTTTFTANFDNTVNTFHGTKSIDVSGGSSGNYLEFTNATVLNSVDFSALKMYIRLKATVKKQSNLSVQFFNGSTPVSNQVQLSTSNGFDKNVVNSYQNVSPLFSTIGFTSSSFDRFRLYYTGSNFPGLYLDYITLQTGVENTGGGTSGTFVTNVYTNNGDTTFQDKSDGSKSIVRFPSYDTVKYKSPIFYDVSDSTIKLKTDSLPQLAYKSATRDTTLWKDTTLIDKGYLNDRLSGFSGGGGTGGGISEVVADYGLINVNDSTLKVDSLKFSTKEWRQKGIDSVQANINVNTTAIAGKQDAITLTTVGSSGAATLTGGTLNIPQYTGGVGGTVSLVDSVTEQKTYYHGEFYWNHGLNTSTGAFTSDKTLDITDLLPIDGSTSVTITTTDSTDITIYGWTYDTSFTPISEIRSNSLISTKLKTYTFTTPSNARYYCIYTKAASDSFNLRLKVYSTNNFTHPAVITPEQYTGNDRQKIQKALNDQRFFRGAKVECKGLYRMDSALIMYSGNTLVLNNATLKTAYNGSAAIIKNEVFSGNFFRANREIKIIGQGTAIISGGNYAATALHTLDFVGVDNFEISGIAFRSTTLFAARFYKARFGTISNIYFDDGLEHLNQDGLHFNLGCHNINIYDIRGSTGDDIIAFVNDSAEILSNKTTEAYLKADSNAIFAINVENVQRKKTTRIDGGGANFRFLPGDGFKIHDINVDGVTGDSYVSFEQGSYFSVAPKAGDVYNVRLSNISSPIRVYRPIKNVSFVNILKYDALGQLSCALPDSSSKIYRQYVGEDARFIDTVISSLERGIIKNIATFSLGMTDPADTAAFTTGKINGMFYNGSSDTIIVTGLRIGLQGTSPSINTIVYFGTSLGTGTTKLINAGTDATNTTTGTNVTSFDNQKIPPGNWVWVTFGTVTTKPTAYNITIMGYQK